MAIKLAFSTVACPQWTTQEVVERAREMGYAGVELRTFGPGGGELASDPALADPAKMRDLFVQAEIEPVCLSTSVALDHRDSPARSSARQQVLDSLALASAIGCSAVRVFGYEVAPGVNRRAVIQNIVDQAAPLVEAASDLGVQILFENAGSFNHAKEWWWLFNILDHPLMGMCWNVANAAAAGEPPSVSVPCLNSRIRLAKGKDTRLGEGSGFVPLGEGTVGVEQYVKRLAGIGYDGFISVEWDRMWLPSLAPPEEYLPDAIGRIQVWLDQIADTGKKGFSDAAPMNKELKKLLEEAKKKADSESKPEESTV